MSKDIFEKSNGARSRFIVNLAKRYGGNLPPISDQEIKRNFGGLPPQNQDDLENMLQAQESADLTRAAEIALQDNDPEISASVLKRYKDLTGRDSTLEKLAEGGIDFSPIDENEA